MARKKQDRREPRESKPDHKGKQRANAQDQPGPSDPAGPSFWDSGAGHQPQAPAKKKGRKTRSQKRHEEEEAEDALAQESDTDIYFIDSGQNPLRARAAKLHAPTTSAPAGPSSDGATTLEVATVPKTASPLPSPILRLREDVTSSAPTSPSIPSRDDITSSASSRLPSRVREDTSSNASSRASKRRRDPSPPLRRQHSRLGMGHHPSAPAANTSTMEQRIAVLELQVRRGREEMVGLREQLSSEFELGFRRGRVLGIEEAAHVTAKPPSSTADEEEDLRRATAASRRTSRRPDTSTPGAGPSRSRDPTSRRSSPGPSRARRRQSRGEPPPPPTGAHHELSGDTLSDARNYEVSVIKKGGDILADPSKVKWPGFACIPLPEWRQSHPGTVIVRGPTTPPNPEDATSYLELWAGFALGRTVPDPIRRLFQAIGLAFHPSDARDAVLGYGLTRRIAVANTGTPVDRDTINAFLVTLAAYHRAVQLLVGSQTLWAYLLSLESPAPFDNWRAMVTFLDRDTWPRQDFGLTFIPPADAAQPWVIHTMWKSNDFTRVLLALRPSAVSLRRLLAYADVFIRTRPAAQPLPGVFLPGQSPDRMYTAPFTTAPETPEAFIEEPAVPASGDETSPMEVDAAPAAPLPAPLPQPALPP